MKRKYEMENESIECPLCCEFLSLPIYQCQNGHALCATCSQNLQGKACPYCLAMPFSYTRNLVVEKILESLLTTCVHASVGCTEMVKISAKEEHEREECEYRQLKCPVLGCIYKGPKHGIPKHFQHVHKIETHQFRAGSRRGSFKMTEDCLINGHVLVMARKDLLLVKALLQMETYLELHPCLRSRYNLVVFRCSSFGNKPLEYNLKVTVENEEGASSVSNSSSFEGLALNNQLIEPHLVGNNFHVVPMSNRSAQIRLELSLL